MRSVAGKKLVNRPSAGYTEIVGDPVSNERMSKAKNHLFFLFNNVISKVAKGRIHDSIFDGVECVTPTIAIWLPYTPHVINPNTFVKLQNMQTTATMSTTYTGYSHDNGGYIIYYKMSK